MEQKKENVKEAGNEIREGQENSSILHDKKDPDQELHDVTKKDETSTNQEEFIDDDANTIKEDK